MLILERKPGEKIVIGDNITLTLVDVCRGKARIGIIAPKSVPVFRSELLVGERPPQEKGGE